MFSNSLTGGFENAPHASARAFRVALDVMARPGTTRDITGAMPPKPMSPATGTLLLTLCDPETPVWLAPSLNGSDISDWLRFHTGAPIAKNRSDAMFAIGDWDELTPLTDFAIGTAEYPDRSATLIVQMETLCPTGTTLHGPGIKDTATFGLPASTEFQHNAALFPLGLDFFFTAGGRVAALPRTTKQEG